MTTESDREQLVLDAPPPLSSGSWVRQGSSTDAITYLLTSAD
jgi:hypothetical protein